MSDLRQDSEFDRLEGLRKEKSSVSTYKSDEKRRSRESETSFKGRDDFRINTFNVILDSLRTELSKRAEKYDHLHSIFGFFEDIDMKDSTEISKKRLKL